MSKTFILSLVLAATAITAAVAGGYGHNSNPSSLLGVIANVGTPRGLADVKANVLNNTVKADVQVGSSQPSYGYNGGYGHNSNAQLADINVNVPGIARIQADVGQQNRRGTTLLGISANVLGGGVGHR